MKKASSKLKKLQKQRLEQNTFVSNQCQKLTQVIQIMETLGNMRLIQKLSRPIQLKRKNHYLNQYIERVNGINRKIDEVQKSLEEKKITSEGIKQKSIYEELTSSGNEIKKKIRMVQDKYNELFYEGSFKHFQKVKRVFKLQRSVPIMIIEEWSMNCIEKMNFRGGNCC